MIACCASGDCASNHARELGTALRGSGPPIPNSRRGLMIGTREHRPHWWSSGPGSSSGHSVPFCAMHEGQVRCDSSVSHCQPARTSAFAECESAPASR